MIKFFRHIRQRLLSESKFSKYMLYAIGEIVLVVIGILIALQINEWNQERQQNKEEQQALSNLKEDFEYNQIQLDSILIKTKESIALKFELLDHTGSKSAPKTESDFNILLNASFNFFPFYPRNGSLDEIIFSGKLRIIDNQELRSKLSSWNPQFDDIVSTQIIVDREIEKATDYFLKKGSWLNADAVRISQTAKSNPFPESGFDVDNRVVLQDLEFENRIENLIYQNDKLIHKHIAGLELIAEILTLIEDEIE